MAKQMRSWKTTFGGILSMTGAALIVVPDDAPGAKYVKPWAGFLAALGAGIVGIFGRDNTVTSEQVLAKRKRSEEDPNK